MRWAAVSEKQGQSQAVTAEMVLGVRIQSFTMIKTLQMQKTIIRLLLLILLFKHAECKHLFLVCLFVFALSLFSPNLHKFYSTFTHKGKIYVFLQSKMEAEGTWKHEKFQRYKKILSILYKVDTRFFPEWLDWRSLLPRKDKDMFMELKQLDYLLSLFLDHKQFQE